MSESTRARAPWPLWLIGALSLLWNGWSLIFIADAFLRGEPMDVSHGIWLVGAGMGVVGSVFLIMRSRVSATLLATAFALTMISVFVPLLLDGEANKYLAMTAIIIVFYALATGLPYLYSRRMAKKGVLR